jgi:lipopolysaccharide assembly outer membrane protein LptD (OstA)
MKKKIVVVFLVTIFIFLIAILINSKIKKTIKKVDITEENIKNYQSNLIVDVEYVAKDAKGNKYIITAATGEIDNNNSDVIFLNDVKSKIILKNSNNITIESDYGKYNTVNYDTIFSESVILNYLDNQITGEYLDFSILRNTMIISRNVTYANEKNILKADVIEVEIDTKDAKIFMYEETKKVKIESKD